LIISYSQTRK